MLGNVEEAVAQTKRLLKRFDEVNMKLGEDLKPGEMEKLLEEQGKLQDAIEAANGWDLDRTLEIAMDALRCPPPDADVTKLSGGERRRVALCRIAAASAPTCCCSTSRPTTSTPRASPGSSTTCTSTRARSSRSPTIATSSTTSPAGSSSSTAAPASPGRATTRRGSSRSRSASQGEEKAESARQRTLARELEWVRASPRARQAKSKARLAAYEEMLAEESQKREETIEISIPPGPRLGDVVVKAEKLRKGYGDNLLIEDLTFNLPRGGIVGVIGANGAGKTTLFRMITGQEKPDGGTLRIGETVKLAYVDQSRDTLDGDKTAFEEIAQGAEILELGKRKIPARAYVSGFNFKGTDQQKQVKDLSGGERNRVHLAKLLRAAATCCCSTSRPTTSTSTRCARSRTRCWPSPAAWSSSATIAGSSTASPPTSSPSRATARSSGSRATTRTTRPTAGAAWAPTPTSPTASSTRS